jgi:protein-S-isoprenylcysteine O-methyltransferase Ste14
LLDGGITKLALFAVISCGLLYISWKPLHVPRSHGFYRFFAWEAILALILINSSAWFSDPLSALQIISWILLTLSLIIVGQGFYKLRLGGKPGGQRQDNSLLAFEKTSALVTTGIYRFIRHPLYASLLFLAWGAFLKEVTSYSICLVGLATFLLIATAKADEAECIQYFGAPYEDYMKQTKMFIPWLF